jgi:hypothetical protein
MTMPSDSTSTRRPPAIHHCTSEPLHFFGRGEELTLLDRSLTDPSISLVGMIGPGGQGKTATVQHWLAQLRSADRTLDGLFFWSFYRGKDSELCLRECLAYATGQAGVGAMAASYCVDHLVPILRRERWVVVLDGAEVVQHESGAWFGRFLHPELGRLLEELASGPLPGAVVVTSRFPLPGIAQRRHAHVLDLAALSPASARELLRSLGAWGTDAELDAAAAVAGHHAKAVELLAVWLARFHGGSAKAHRQLPAPPAGGAPEERSALRVLAAFHRSLPEPTRDLLALATAFRHPPTEDQLLAYLASPAVAKLLAQTWQRSYVPLGRREQGWLERQVQGLVEDRLLERVGAPGHEVIDAHPLVRRGFEQELGAERRRDSAASRAGFLRGRPDRRAPQSLAEAREDVELFHAYCEAGLWNEADGVFVALDNPKHRLLAPAFERDLLLRFFPGGDWRQAPLWPGFGRWRSLAICLEMLGQFEDAIDVYRPEDAALAGDALIAHGKLEPLLERENVPSPWQDLWRAYRCHALALRGQTSAAQALARTLLPRDIYEWAHWFESLLRTGGLREGDLAALTAAAPESESQGWRALVRRRIEADGARVLCPDSDLNAEYRALTEAFDRGGLPWERAIVRLGHARWLVSRRQPAEKVVAEVLELGQRHKMPVVRADALEIAGRIAEAQQVRADSGCHGPARP